MAAIHPGEVHTGEERMRAQVARLCARSAAAAGVDSMIGSICSREWGWEQPEAILNR